MLRPLSAMDTSSARDCTRTRRIVIGLFLLVILAARLTDLFRPFPGDGAMFIYMGRLTSQGGGIGREMIDNKFPTVGLMMSAPWLAFGASWPAWVLMLIVMGFAGPFLLARSARRHLGEESYLPTLLFALVFCNFSYGVDGFHLEAILVFFGTIAASSAMSALCDDDSRDSFVVGLAAVTGAMLKPSALACLAAFGLAMVICHWRKPGTIARHAAAALGGAAVVGLVVLVYLVGTDLLQAIPVISRQIARYGAQSQWQAFDAVKWVIVLLAIGFPLLVRGWIFRRDRLTPSINSPLLIFALLWFAIEALGVTMQGRMYRYHFHVLAVPATLLFASLRRRDRLFPLLAALTLPMLLSLYGAIPQAHEVSSPTRRLPISEYLLAHARPDDRVWADAQARLLVETGLPPASRFLTTFLWSNDDESAGIYAKMLINDFDEREPTYVVFPTDLDRHINFYINGIEELSRNPRRAAGYRAAWKQLRAYVAEHYAPEARVAGETVFRRKIEEPKSP
jgi:Dolichyl-phosphate-mannose-protein mannosyltransferase